MVIGLPLDGEPSAFVDAKDRPVVTVTQRMAKLLLNSLKFKISILALATRKKDLKDPKISSC